MTKLMTIALLTFIPMVSSMLVGCGEEDADPATGEAADSTAATGSETTVDDGAAPSGADVWLADRYGPESGTILFEVTSGGETTLRRQTFADHGRTEKLEWWLTSGRPTGPRFVSLIRGDTLYFRAPADSIVQVRPWSSDLPTVLPNFRNLTDEMRSRYSLEEIDETKEILGRELTGYSLTSDGATSRIWVDDGVMLYGEVDGIPEQGIDPMIVKAVDYHVGDVDRTRLTIDDDAGDGGDAGE